MLDPEEYYQGGYLLGVSFYGDQLGPVIVLQMNAEGRDILR